MLSRKISGDKLRRVREDRGLSVKAVADAVNRTPWNIYKIEQGKTQPSAVVYKALKAALDVGDNELVDDTVGSAA
ncbi:Helix-turn-helix domain-containing protein [Streptomyces sp. DI166]|uniref:helix-turn-helix domain-containing protein n=1 Tax=Streptomyces sp. DI166 TaxID=1839783 RepID=UPI0007F4F8A7|nr:helix-turn-helix transcriptional regulator [Streptomyces sp. DI166]SBT89417.1 Helix-turn-helix domain-containing protein [Streptomyces sp. DI166]